MRILMVSDVYFPRVNGVSTSIAIFRRQLALLGHEVTLLVPDYPGAKPESGVRRIPSRYLFVDPEDRIMRSAPVRGMVQDLRSERYDLIHIQTPFIAHRLGIQLSRELQLPVVETYHTFFEEYLYCYLPWLPRRFLRWAARHFSRRQCNELDAVVTPSTAMSDVLRRYGVCTPMEVIPTGIVLEEFQRGDGKRFRSVWGISPGRPVLLYVGRAAFEKNIDFLLEVTGEVRQAIPDVLFVVAGEGPAVHALQQQAMRLGLNENVHFVGYLSRDGELQDCYSAADAFIFASRTETQGLVLLEAMASGVPVVSTAVMGTRDVLRDGEGALVAEENARDFAQKVKNLLGDPEQRHDLSQRARRYAMEWSADAIAERMEIFYCKVIAAKRTNRAPSAEAITEGS